MNKQKIAVIVSILIVLTGIIDTELNLLQEVGFSLLTINRIKLAGLVLSAVLPSALPLFLKKSVRK